MKKRVIFFIIFLIVGFTAIVLIVGRGEKPEHPFRYSDFHKSKPTKPISKDGLIADIDYYLDLIDRIHPDPYRVVSSDAVKKKAESLKKRIRALPTETIPLLRCYFLLKELVAFLQDEHHDVMFSRSWIQDLKTPFPLSIRIFDNRVYMEQDRSDSGIPPFAEILTINQLNTGDLIKGLLPFINETLPHYKIKMLEKVFGDWLVIYFRLKPPWQITYRVGEKEYRVQIPAKSEAELKKISSPDMKYREYPLEVVGKSVPVLEIPAFWSEDRQAYDHFMDDFFTKHKDSKYLVIDLRRNPGGDGTWGYFVLDYLTEVPYLIEKRFDIKVSKEFKKIAWYVQKMKYYKRKIPRLLWWFPPLKNWVHNSWLEQATRVGEGEWAREHGSYRTPDPSKMKFKGKIILLVSHETNSAAVVFSSIFKHHRLGLVVGRETGGRLKFTSDPYTIEMPNSTLWILFPTAIMELSGDNPDRGVLPDVVVPLTFEDLKTGIDRDIRKIKEIIKADMSGESVFIKKD